MQLCKVTGTIVAPKKDISLEKTKLLIVHPLLLDGKLDGVKDMLAIDPGYSAGIDDIVIVAKEGSVVRQLVKNDHIPANTVILGVVDDWSVPEVAKT